MSHCNSDPCQDPKHVLFNHACRYGFYDQNPISWVRVRKKRKEIPAILTFGEAARLLHALKPRERLTSLSFLVALADFERFKYYFRIKEVQQQTSARTASAAGSSKSN